MFFPKYRSQTPARSVVDASMSDEQNELNDLKKLMEDADLRERAEHFRGTSFAERAIARSTALTEENEKLKKLLSEAYDKISTLSSDALKIVDKMMDEEQGEFEEKGGSDLENLVGFAPEDELGYGEERQKELDQELSGHIYWTFKSIALTSRSSQLWLSENKAYIKKVEKPFEVYESNAIPRHKWRD